MMNSKVADAPEGGRLMLRTGAVLARR